MFQQTLFVRASTQWLKIGLVGALMASLGWAHAQSNASSYPQKPIKILVGFSPGGVPDIVARVLAPKFTEDWKQAVVVENRLGAGSNIAAQAAASSAPDGYTLLSVSSAHAISPAIYSKLSYDASKDFAGITLTATGPALVIVSPELNVNNMKEFLALAKSKPGQLNYASAGVGSGAQFAAELLKSQAGIDLAHIPFKGIPEALTDTMAGRTHLFIAVCQRHQFGEGRQSQSHCRDWQHADARFAQLAHSVRIWRAWLQMDFLVWPFSASQHTA
jgi:tripartite-type tricarboxylate transporter receptor subunit TctC